MINTKQSDISEYFKKSGIKGIVNMHSKILHNNFLKIIFPLSVKKPYNHLSLPQTLAIVTYFNIARSTKSV